ncbi:Gfo/Idh/MocA family oxidoreductase [Actinoplanes sp. NPDC051343]|uniref:Gfo/Idh/MocA family oxidoreductase n=1 Tax=Actinoplanes sp. NPDC051343 TaxID=3363906 RepID=UPI00378FD9C8
MSRPVERVLVVGYGYAGRRFAASIDYLGRRGVPVEIVGFCDSDVTKLPDGLRSFRDITDAVTQLRPTVVCVTVNESAHIAAFEAIANFPPMLVLAEKPLIADPADEKRVTKSLAHHDLSMNLVERYSPILPEFHSWLEDHGPFQVVRAESFWGKHRIGDTRPTMGVLSELIHPLDLVEHVFRTEPFKVKSAAGLVSDFSPHGTAILDSIDVHGTAGSTPVMLHASFAWPARMRQMTGLLWSRRHGMFRADFTFDTPHWDCDQLRISSIGSTGRFNIVHEMQTTNEDVPAEIRGVGKVAAFIEASIRAWRGQGPRDQLASLMPALRLQRTLDDIDQAAAPALLSGNYRRT